LGKTGSKPINVKPASFILLLLLSVFHPARIFSQPDSLLLSDSLQENDTVIPWHLKLFSAGLQFSNTGTIQYFDGYSHEIMYLNSQTGLPLYNDWNGYSSFTIFPRFYSITGGCVFSDTTKNIRVRVAGTFIHKKDSMEYGSGFSINDTVFGRVGAEVSSLAGVVGTLSKQSRRFFKIFRAYAGVEGELDFGWRSKIRLYEFTYDYGDQEILELNQFNAFGRPHLALFGGACLGLESRFLKNAGIYAEVRSGIGLHWIPQEKPIGISRINICVGACYYFAEKSR
jgi:hypothetical protein